MKTVLSIVTGLVMLAANALAVDAVRFSFEVFQRDSANQRDVLLYVDTADVASGIPAVGFMAVMSVEIRVMKIDSAGVSYSVQVVTASRPAATASREILSEFGLPLKLSDIKGKNGARHALVVRPLSRQTIAEGACSVTSARMDQFKFDPTAHTDIYYLKNTLGDYYWNLAKGLFETEYEQFDALNKFNVPGKFSIYLCPCPILSVIWDERFGQVIDPTRNAAYVLFSTRTNTADPFVLMALAAYRQYGYAPAFLVDGFANIGSAALDDLKSAASANQGISVASLLDSYAYLSSDPRKSDMVSAGFVKYLISRYSLDRFLSLYSAADDLNLRASIESTYGKSIGDLDREFSGWVDTVKVSFKQYQYCSDRAEAMFDYAGQRKYAAKMQALAITPADSLNALWVVCRAAFNSGDFYGATETLRAYMKFDTSLSNVIALSGYQMMNGLYDSARADLLRGQARDTANMLIIMNLGLNKLFTGDTVGAKEMLATVASTGGSGAAEAKIILGHLYLHGRERAEQARAIPLFQEAVAAFQSRISSHDIIPGEQMWLGMAFLGLDDQSNALSSLQVADYLESRPFYRGIIALWLGKAADLRGERDVALGYYNAVLSSSAAHYTQAEARRYRFRPYTQ
jgi:tetratricopeptide (TPR) repeat protein